MAIGWKLRLMSGNIPVSKSKPAMNIPQEKSRENEAPRRKSTTLERFAAFVGDAVAQIPPGNRGFKPFSRMLDMNDRLVDLETNFQRLTTKSSKSESSKQP